MPVKEISFIAHETAVSGFFDDFQTSNDTCRFRRAQNHWKDFSLFELKKTKYSSLLLEGKAAMTAMLSTSSSATDSPVPHEGWALKNTKKAYRFKEKQRSYYEAKFNISQTTGRKLDPEIVAKEKRHALDLGRKRLFEASEFLSVQQITSFFSRLSAKTRQQVVTIEQDICAVQEEMKAPGKSKIFYRR